MPKHSRSSMSSTTRRQFLISAGAVLAFPTIIPASALGRENKPAPSERITLGIVGCGGQGLSNMEFFFGQKDCQVVAACDVDKRRVETAINRINKHHENQDA